MMFDDPNETAQDVNDATPTNAPKPTPADSELGGDTPSRAADAPEEDDDVDGPGSSQKNAVPSPNHPGERQMEPVQSKVASEGSGPQVRMPGGPT